MALTIYYTTFHPAYFTRSCEKGPGNGRFSQMVRAFREFRSERKKRTTSGGCPQFPKRFSGKLPFHLTSNRNFRIFWLNGKHPLFFVSPTPHYVPRETKIEPDRRLQLQRLFFSRVLDISPSGVTRGLLFSVKFWPLLNLSFSNMKLISGKNKTIFVKPYP